MVISTTDSNKNQSKNQEQKLGYVYRHIRLDTNMPFYIGISTVNDKGYNRAYCIRRSKEWKDIVKNTKYRVEILLENVPVSILSEKEKYFIKLYGRLDKGTGTLVNKTSGGQGRWDSPSEKRVILELYDENGIFTKKYTSLTEAYKEINFNVSNIISGKRKISHGYRFKKINNSLYRGYKLSDAEYNEIQQGYLKRKIDVHKKVKLELYDEKEIIYKSFDSLKDAKKSGEFCDGDIIACIKGKRKKHKNHRFEKINEHLIRGYKLSEIQLNEIKIQTSINKEIKSNKRIELYDINEVFYKCYNSYKEANIDGFSSSGIRKCVRGILKIHNEHKFIKINNNLYHGFKV